MAKNDPNYRDPQVTTTKDSGGMPSWLKWLLIALAVLVLLWLLFTLFLDNEPEEATVIDDDAAVVVEEDVDTELVPVEPTD